LSVTERISINHLTKKAESRKKKAENFNFYPSFPRVIESPKAMGYSGARRDKKVLRSEYKDTFFSPLISAPFSLPKYAR
jgi:hypothetical protein